MAQIEINANALAKFPPLRTSNGLTVQQLFARGREWWTQGAKYRGRDGKPIDIFEGDSLAGIISFDITGAIDYCYSSAEDSQAARIRVGMLLRTTATRWNDAPGRTWEEVCELVRKANI